MAETTSSEQTDNPAFWCVGLGGGPEEDKEKTLERFISQNIWENLGDNEGLAETVNKVRAGDRLAIRTTHKRKDDLPFDSRGFYVSTVLVRAVGTVTDNPEDSHTLHVNWERCDPYREWLFFSHTPNIWQPETSNPHAARFVDFCLKKEAQDINWFRNRDYWSWRYGDDPRFAWSGFYTQFADRLLTFRDRRDELGTMLRELASGPESFPALQALVQRVPGDLLSDVSPFSVMALFNCQDSADERTRAARVLANRIGVTEPVPTVFAGVSVLTEPACLDAAIAEDGTVSSVGADALWELFAVSLAYRWLPDGGSWLQFVSVFDNALRHCRAGWNLPQALSWGRPWKYPALDETSRLHIAKKYGETIVSQQECCTGKQYLELRERLLKRFNEYKNSVHWFPALFLEAGQIQPA
ncbi:MAG: hypothetical protein Q4F72_06060, partial [Desulfovibrionaceae bacterium]|nr:hypothetical protein [Desulfovibrionaceae bacterium]